MNKTCENCRWVQDWKDSTDMDYAKFGICKYPSGLKYIGNPRIFIECEYSNGCDTVVVQGVEEAYNSNLPCPKWEEPKKELKKPPTVEYVRGV